MNRPASPDSEIVPPGDRAGFEDLYVRYRRDVWSLAYARWMDSNTALDITQETFLKLWKQLETGEELKNPRAWLLRVARNLADDWAKSAFRRHGTQSDEYLNTVARPGNAPLEEMVREEGFARIRAILDELPTGDREILTLRYALDYDSPKIAEILGVPVTAIHMRLSRARQRMAELLAAHGVQNPS